MKKLITLFMAILAISSIALANVIPDRDLEKVWDPTNPLEKPYFQCINPGTECDGTIPNQD